MSNVKTAAQIIDTEPRAAALYDLVKRQYKIVERKYSERIGDPRRYYTLHKIETKRIHWWSSRLKEVLGPDLLLPYSGNRNRFDFAETYLKELILFGSNYYFEPSKKDWFN